MSNISFANPWLLFIALPLIAAVLTPFLVTVRRDNVNGHNVTALALHLLICVCITLAAAGMSFEKVITETDVYVLADVSYSAEDNLDKVQDCVEKVAGKLPKNSKTGVICFGRNYQLMSKPGGKIPDVRKADKVDKSATDIGSALRYAGNLFDDDVIKRIVVITDGAETVAANNIIKVVNSLQDRGVYVDAVYIDDNISDSAREVQVDAVEATPTTYINKEEEAQVLVRASCGDRDRTDGYISLYKDGNLEVKRSATFYDGLNVITLPLSTEQAGRYSYEVKVETAEEDGDSSPHNNSCLFTQKITDERKVLFIGGSGADETAGRKIYGSEGVTYYTGVTNIPSAVEELCVYDEIALCNFDVRTVNARNMFISSLETLVSDFGKTLTTYGNTFVQEDENDETLQRFSGLLPVSIGNNDRDARLVTIVLDISRSENFSGRLAVAKKAALQLLDGLTSADTVMVIGFTTAVTELLPPTPLTSPAAIKRSIEQLTVADSDTLISEAFKYAAELMPVRFRDRQLILISDGINSAGDNAEAKNLAIRLSQERVSVSAIGVYPTPDGDKLLNSLVFNPAAGDKVFYKSITHESEIGIVLGGVAEEEKQVRIEGDGYKVVVRRPDEAVAQGADAVADIKGFWYNSAKSTAKTVLTATYYRDKITSFNVPIYAYWTSGRGKVVSFLSDISAESGWTENWTADSGGETFLSNIPVATLPAERINAPFAVDVQTKGNTTTVNVIASASLKTTPDFTATLTDPSRLAAQKQLTYNSGDYFATFNTDAPGTYAVLIEYSCNGVRYTAETEFSVSYYAEYDAFASFSKSQLFRLLTANGKILDLEESGRIENEDSSYTSFTFSFIMPLMIICAVAFVVDVIIRQLRWKDVTSFFSFGRRK